MIARSEITVRIEADTRLSRAWIRLMARLAPLIGVDRAYRWARRLALPLTRYRIDGGCWRFLRRKQQ